MRNSSVFISILAFLSYALAIYPANAHVGRETGLPIPRFVTLKSKETNIRIGPGKEYKTINIYRCKGYPLKILAEFGTWRKVEDHNQFSGWLHQSLLSGKRNVVIINNILLSKKSLIYTLPQNQFFIFKIPDENASPVALVELGTVLALLECKDGWCKIATRKDDGFDQPKIKGWVRKINLWGY